MPFHIILILKYNLISTSLSAGEACPTDQADYPKSNFSAKPGIMRSAPVSIGIIFFYRIFTTGIMNSFMSDIKLRKRIQKVLRQQKFEGEQESQPNKEVSTRCGNAQFAGMNTMRQKKEYLLSSCLRTGPARYAVRRRMHLKRYNSSAEQQRIRAKVLEEKTVG